MLTFMLLLRQLPLPMQVLLAMLFWRWCRQGSAMLAFIILATRYICQCRCSADVLRRSIPNCLASLSCNCLWPLHVLLSL